MNKEFLANTLRIIIIAMSGFVLSQLYSMNSRLSVIEVQMKMIIEHRN